MDQQFGDNLITITDEDGRSYELEILAQFEYKDAEYLALKAGSKVVAAKADE